MLFWTPHFSVLDSTFFVLHSTFWLDSTLKIDPDTLLVNDDDDVGFSSAFLYDSAKFCGGFFRCAYVGVCMIN